MNGLMNWIWHVISASSITRFRPMTSNTDVSIQTACTLNWVLLISLLTERFEIFEVELCMINLKYNNSNNNKNMHISHSIPSRDDETIFSRLPLGHRRKRPSAVILGLYSYMSELCLVNDLF